MSRTHARETLEAHCWCLRMEGISEYPELLYHMSQIINYYTYRLSQVGVVSFGSECPSHGVYGRVTEVKHWIQFLAQGAEDSNCNKDIPVQQGNMLNVSKCIN